METICWFDMEFMTHTTKLWEHTNWLCKPSGVSWCQASSHLLQRGTRTVMLVFQGWLLMTTHRRFQSWQHFWIRRSSGSSWLVLLKVGLMLSTSASGGSIWIWSQYCCSTLELSVMESGNSISTLSVWCCPTSNGMTTWTTHDGVLCI